MDFKRFFNIKAVAGALGLAAAFAASSASAGINWGSPITLFEDDDLDFLIQEGEQDGILKVGDVLVAVLELNTANGVDITGEELTGVAVIEIVAIVDINGNGSDDIIFGPATEGFNFYAGTNVVNGDMGGGTLVSFWTDPSNDLVIDAGSVNAGTESCQTLNGCLAQATNGDPWLTAGIGEPSDFWVALDANPDTNVVFAAPSVLEFGAVNTGLSIFANDTGRVLIDEAFSCAPFCGGDGTVDLLAGGSVKGGANGGQNGGEWIATSDFDMQLAVVPSPGTLALLGLGLLGLGAARRRS